MKFLNKKDNLMIVKECLVRILSKLSLHGEEPADYWKGFKMRPVFVSYLIACFPEESLNGTREDIKERCELNARAFIEAFEAICFKVENGEAITVEMVKGLKSRVTRYLEVFSEWYDNDSDLKKNLRRRVEQALVALLNARKLIDEGDESTLAEFDANIDKLKEKLQEVGGDYESVVAAMRASSLDAIAPH